MADKSEAELYKNIVSISKNRVKRILDAEQNTDKIITMKVIQNTWDIMIKMSRNFAITFKSSCVNIMIESPILREM